MTAPAMPALEGAGLEPQGGLVDVQFAAGLEIARPRHVGHLEALAERHGEIEAHRQVHLQHLERARHSPA
ncbi:MAG: hypothetical protein WDN30_04710 [Pararobbsia sp.]